MLDPFYLSHTKIVFAGNWRTCLEEDQYANALTLADRTIDPPARDMLSNGAQHVRHEALFKFFAEEELYLSGIKTRGYLDKALYETIILHKLYETEWPARESDYTVRRSLVVLGGMIQSRLTRLLIELSRGDIRALVEMPVYARQLNRETWTSAIMGASATAKAFIEFGSIDELSIYAPTVVDDVQFGIDLIVEVEWAQTGFCVSVKSCASQPDCLFLAAPMYRDNSADWERIKQGTERFNEVFHRNWHTVLLQFGRKKNGIVDLWGKKPELQEAMLLALTEGQFISVFGTP